jgi:hypothetical protein
MHKWFVLQLGMFEIQTAKKGVQHSKKIEAQFFAVLPFSTPTTFNLTTLQAVVAFTL